MTAERVGLPICAITDKVSFPTEASAKRVGKSLKKKRREGYGFLRPYRCGGHWHLGHGTKTGQTKPGRKFR